MTPQKLAKIYRNTMNNIGNVSMMKGLFTTCGRIVTMLKVLATNTFEYIEDFKDTHERYT